MRGHIAIASACLALAACSQATESAEQPTEPVETSPVAEQTASLPALPGAQDKDPQALLDYWKAAIESGDYAAAAKAWNDEALAQQQQDYGQTAPRVTYGEQQLEGAAGSSYLTVPVTISAIGPDGESIDRTGTMTARRVNDVPGASAQQLSWRIRSIDWN